MPAQKGNKVNVEYTGTLEDGTVFDSSERQGHPLEFELGAGHVIKGFDNAIIGMNKGEEKQVIIPPADAYGEANPQLHKDIPKDQLPKEQDIKVGTILGMKLPDGRQLPVKVINVADTTVTIDLNHPLAGKTLTFKIKLLDITA